jgi:hypothetical protein
VHPLLTRQLRRYFGTNAPASPEFQAFTRAVGDAYVAFDDGHIYVAFDAKDPDPKAIRAHLDDRDLPVQDDTVGFFLDKI